MIHIIYNPDMGMILPDSQLIPFTDNYVREFIDSPTIYEIQVSSRDVVYGFVYAMKNQNRLYTNLTISYSFSTEQIGIDSDYNFYGTYLFVNDMEKILMSFF